MKGIVRVSALVAALLTLAACVAARVPEARAAASPSPAAVTYRIGIGQDCDGMNPFGSWSGISWECFRLGYDFLTWYDAEYRPVPDVATRWETSEDGRTWTFHIREGMKWHDGRPLTAHDVAFTYNLILDTQHWSYIQYLTGVTSVTAPDDVTVVITTSTPNAGMLALYIPILPQHVWEKVDPDNLDAYEQHAVRRLRAVPGDRAREGQMGQAGGQSGLPAWSSAARRTSTRCTSSSARTPTR